MVRRPLALTSLIGDEARPFHFLPSLENVTKLRLNMTATTIVQIPLSSSWKDALRMLVIKENLPLRLPKLKGPFLPFQDLRHNTRERLKITKILYRT